MEEQKGARVSSRGEKKEADYGEEVASEYEGEEEGALNTSGSPQLMRRGAETDSECETEAEEVGDDDLTNYISRSWLIWNWIMFGTTMYIVLIVPVTNCFDFEPYISILSTDILTEIFLIADLVINFITPFESDGFLIHSRRRIAVNYLTGWFIPDFIAAVPLMVMALFSKQIYIWRVNKLARVFRIPYFFSLWEKYTSRNPTIIRIAKFSFLVLLLAHWISCMYFLIVRSEGAQAVEWTGDAELPYRSFISQYLKSLNWSLVTMTGYGGVLPFTDIESIFSLVVVYIGVAVYVTIIGTVGSMLTNLDSSASYFRQKMDTINDYMRYRRIPEGLQNRVRSYYTYLWKTRRGQDESRVLEDLPRYLREEVAEFINQDLIRKVPLFRDASKHFVRAVMSALRPRVALPQTYIIRQGEVGREMFFISRGEVEVLIYPEGVEHAIKKLKEGDIFGEVALITSEKRTASVRATTYCDLFVLYKDDFDEVVQDFPEMKDRLAEEAMSKLQHGMSEVMSKAPRSERGEHENTETLGSDSISDESEDENLTSASTSPRHVWKSALKKIQLIRTAFSKQGSSESLTKKNSSPSLNADTNTGPTRTRRRSNTYHLATAPVPPALLTGNANGNERQKDTPSPGSVSRLST